MSKTIIKIIKDSGVYELGERYDTISHGSRRMINKFTGDKK